MDDSREGKFRLFSNRKAIMYSKFYSNAFFVYFAGSSATASLRPFSVVGQIKVILAQCTIKQFIQIFLSISSHLSLF